MTVRGLDDLVSTTYLARRRWLDAIICVPRRPLFLCLDGHFCVSTTSLFDATAYYAALLVRVMEVRYK